MPTEAPTPVYTVAFHLKTQKFLCGCTSRLHENINENDNLKTHHKEETQLVLGCMYGTRARIQ